MLKNQDKIIVALDTSSLKEALALADMLGQNVGAFKVGLELLTSSGAPTVVDTFSKKARLFFDGKFKDIPNTVAGAARAVAKLGVWMFNVHCLGGAAMMNVARKAIDKEAEKLRIKRPLIIGVTILTSMDIGSLNEVGFSSISNENDLKKLVVRLALLAKEAGLDGVVASPREIGAIREACGRDFLIVTPGVRPTWAAKGDQKRVTTPREALEAGADYLVIGRPITNPPAEIGTPLEAVKRIIDEIKL